MAKKYDETDRLLLSRDIDGFNPWIDPQEPINEARVKEAAWKLSLAPDEVRRRYQSLAADFGLKIE